MLGWFLLIVQMLLNGKNNMREIICPAHNTILKLSSVSLNSHETSGIYSSCNGHVGSNGEFFSNFQKTGVKCIEKRTHTFEGDCGCIFIMKVRDII